MTNPIKAKDMNVMGHAKGKGIKEKHFKNNIKHENE
jgi:hypothetical protein